MEGTLFLSARNEAQTGKICVISNLGPQAEDVDQEGTEAKADQVSSAEEEGPGKDKQHHPGNFTEYAVTVSEKDGLLL